MNVAKLIDQTFLKKDTNKKELESLCEETREYDFRGLCVFPEHVKFCKELLKDTEVKLTALVDEPTGTSSNNERVKIAQKLKEDGSDEIDIVMKIDDFKNGKYDVVLEDLIEIAKILPTKVIIGSGYLTDAEVKKASELVKEAGAICVKTATGKDPLDNSELPEKAKHVKIMKESAPGLLIKASGKIRSFGDLQMMVDSGADIIGTSSGVLIVKESNGEDIKEKKDGRIIE